MAKKYYVVWNGRQTGIFDNWIQCKAQVDQFAGARFKSFPSLAEAESAFGSSSTSSYSSSSPKSSSAAQKFTKANKPKKSPLTESQIKEMAFDIKIFTDGACEPNPGEAGTGLAVYQNNQISELWYGMYQAVGTNNTAELNGLHQALIMAQDKLDKGQSVAIYCDSKYSIDCITQWAKGWESKGWKKAGGEIKNLDIIKPTYALYQKIAKSVVIHHVNGHVGIEGNELADRMSIVAISTKEPLLSLYQETNNINEILALRQG